ncbi:MAG: HK97 family phage prohead protease [Lachnospiraceae bacterium]|nr:HK97 family phage prohead protease [Lachnospiraceae bacterium]
MDSNIRTMRQVRSIASEFKTREDGEELRIEGYFAVFNSNYQITADMSESVAPGAFSDTLGDDIRALIDHETMFVLGRNRAGTLELREDSHGLWGSILINPNDGDAMNLYSRVQRGDVSQCSFGFDILDEGTEYLADGSIHWTIKKVKLYEVSVCTFPAYPETNVQARQAEYEEIKKRSLEVMREELREKLRGI